MGPMLLSYPPPVMKRVQWIETRADDCHRGNTHDEHDGKDHATTTRDNPQ